MSQSIWTVPSHSVGAVEARRTILAQHQRIQALLEHAGELAERALDQRPLAPDAVASAVGDIHAIFEVHLRFEEAVLIELLSRDRQGYREGYRNASSERVLRLKDEHARQRNTLEALHGEARRGPTLPLLATKLANLVRWLLEDMAEEERRLITPEVFFDDATGIAS